MPSLISRNSYRLAGILKRSSKVASGIVIVVMMTEVAEVSTL